MPSKLNIKKDMTLIDANNKGSFRPLITPKTIGRCVTFQCAMYHKNCHNFLTTYHISTATGREDVREERVSSPEETVPLADNSAAGIIIMVNTNSSQNRSWGKIYYCLSLTNNACR